MHSSYFPLLSLQGNPEKGGNFNLTDEEKGSVSILCVSLSFLVVDSDSYYSLDKMT